VNETDALWDAERPRAALEQVLARPEFHRPIDDPPRWLDELLQRLFGGMSPTPSWIGTGVTILVVAAAVAFVVYALVDGGAFRRRRRGATVVSAVDAAAASRVTARAWFDEGRRAFEAGRHSDAVIALFRGIVARLTELGFLLTDPSRTNREHLRDLGARPREEALLRATMPTFERVRYGERPADEADAKELLDAAAPLFAERAP
jgi:hypothetical protein